MKEAELVRKCQHGDAQAQKALYSKYADSMLRLSLRYVSNQADAEDLVITAFTKVFSHIRAFQRQADGGLEGWIRKIVVNESLMWLRRRHNFNMIETIEEGLPEPDLSQLAQLEAEDILRMIDQLPTGYRIVFNMSVVEGYSHQEISEMLKISEGTSRSQLFKAKVILKKMLMQEGYHYGT